MKEAKITQRGIHDNTCDHCRRKEDEYRARSQKLCGLYPNLKNPHDRKWWKYDPSTVPSRVKCFQFGDKTAQPTATDINSADQLRQLLASDGNTPATTVDPSRRLFILEGLNEAFTTILGAALNVNPLLWLRHSRVALWEAGFDNAGNTSLLPTLVQSNKSFTIDYCQLMRLNIKSLEFTYRCAENERHIASSRRDGELDGIGQVFRKASFWAVPVGTNGWDALLVVDAPFRQALAGNSSSWRIVEPLTPPTPFQGGYADFIDHADIQKASTLTGPPRTSMLDDLSYYIENHTDHLKLTSSPRSVTIFIEKIIASEYMLLIAYNRGLLAHLYYRLSRRSSFEEFRGDWVATSWSDLMAFQRRLTDHKMAVESNMMQLGLPKPSSSPSSSVDPPETNQTKTQPSNWSNTHQDFSYIHAQLTSLIIKADDLINALSSLSSATAAQQSLAEARNVRFLTFIGMTFLPLSLVAGLFSMSGDYQPGAARFWVYFAVCIPFVVLVYTLAYLPSLEYSRTTTATTTKRWFGSFKRFWRRPKEGQDQVETALQKKSG